MTTEEIKAAIQSQIRTNGTGAITGAVLQGVLLDVLAGSKVTDLGNFTTDTALDAAVRSEALRVGEGDTGGVPGNKIILASSSAGDQRNYTYFALSTGSQTRVVRIDPSTGHLQQTQKAKSASAWSAWAELYDTSGGGGSVVTATTDGIVTSAMYLRMLKSGVTDFGTLYDIDILGEKIIDAGWLDLDAPGLFAFKYIDDNPWIINGVAIIVPGSTGERRSALILETSEDRADNAASFLGFTTIKFKKDAGTWKVDTYGDLFDYLSEFGAFFNNVVPSSAQTSYSLTFKSPVLSDKTIQIGAASQSGAGVMTAADKIKLDGIPEGGGGGADPDAFVGVASYGRGNTLLEMSFSKSGGGTSSTNLPMATDTLAGIMSGSDKAKLDKIDLEGKKLITDLGAFNTWALLRTSIVGKLPAFPALAKVANMQVLLLCDDSVSGGAGTRKVFAYDSAGVLYALGCKLSGGRATWDADWTVTDLTKGGAQSAGMSVVNVAEYNTGSVSVSGTAYVAEATADDIEAASSAAVVWIKRFSYSGQPAGDLTGKGGRFYLRLSKDGGMTYYGAWPAVSAAVPGDEYYNQAATTGKAARVGMLFYFAQDGQVRFRAIESDVDSLAVLGAVSALGA